MPLMAQLPTRLARIRARKGLTQRQLADLAGVSKDVVSAIESRSDRQVRALSLHKLAVALEVDIEELFEPEAVAS